MRCFSSRIFKVVAASIALALAGASGWTVMGEAAAQKSARTELKPASLIFLSPKQDIELGQQASKDAEKEMNLIKNTRMDTYVSALGKKLAGYAPGEKYPYQFKVVDDKEINAFALPGGFVYVNRGIFETADTEGQLAGVMAHEVSHVALRHSASQISRATLSQTGLQILGGLLGKSGDILSKVGMSGMGLLLMKNSREAETQADLLGTQILYDASYDTKSMVEFFEKIEAADKGGNAQFLSDHPNPDNRIGSVKKEIDKLGGSRPGARRDTPEFQAIKALVKSMPAPKPKPKPSPTPNPADKSAAPAPASGPATAQGPERPSANYVQAQFGDVILLHPENWRATGQAGNVTLAPNGGLVAGALSYGMIVATFKPVARGNRAATLDDATDQLLASLQRTNPQLRLAGRRNAVRIGGQPAVSVEMTNKAPNGNPETDWVVTVLRPNGVMDYFVAVAPQKDFAQYAETFNTILSRVQFR